MSETIKYTIEGKFGYIEIDDPATLNALDGEKLEALNQIVDQIAADANISVLIIKGAGRAFVAGADIKTQSVLDYQGGLDWGKLGSSIFRKIEKLPIPVIASVGGFALGGGCELALACDIIVASEKAKFGQPEVGLGITPGFSGTQRLPRKIGVGAAKLLIYTGRIVKADEAYRIGLADVMAPEAELEKITQELAEEIAKNGSIAVSKSKAAINEGLDTSLDDGIAIENKYFADCYNTKDQKEGMLAFLEKRTPKFTDQ